MAVFQRDRDREKREGESELWDGGGKRKRLIDCNLENVGFWMIGWCSNRVFEICYFSDVPSNNLKHNPMIPSSSVRKWIYQFFFLLVTMKTTASTSEYYQCWTHSIKLRSLVNLGQTSVGEWWKTQSVPRTPRHLWFLTLHFVFCLPKMNYCLHYNCLTEIMSLCPEWESRESMKEEHEMCYTF